MTNNLSEYYKKKDINIIEMKNIVVVVAIVVLLGSLYFNSNDIKNLEGKKPYINDEQAKNLDIGIAVMAVAIVLSSLYLSYMSYTVEKEQGIEASNLKIIAFSISLIPACILLYSAISNDDDMITGIEPLI